MSHEAYCMWVIVVYNNALYNCLLAYNDKVFLANGGRLLRIVGNVLRNASYAATFTRCNLLGHVHVSPYKWKHRTTQLASELKQPTSSNVNGVNWHQTCFSHCWNAVCAQSKSVSVVVDTKSRHGVAIACNAVKRWRSCIIFWFFDNYIWHARVISTIHLFFLFNNGSLFIKICWFFVKATFVCEEDPALFVLFSLGHKERDTKHHASCGSWNSTRNVEGYLIRVRSFIDKTWKERAKIYLVVHGTLQRQMDTKWPPYKCVLFHFFLHDIPLVL